MRQMLLVLLSGLNEGWHSVLETLRDTGTGSEPVLWGWPRSMVTSSDLKLKKTQPKKINEPGQLNV